MGIKPIAALALALAVAAPAFARPSVTLVPKPGAAPQDCIPIAQIRESIVRDDRTIDFRVGRKMMRVTLDHSCPGLGFERRFSYATSLSQLCSSDIITVLTTAGGGLSRGASCGLSPFQEVVPAPR